MLSKAEINRYSKQLLLPEIGMKGQEKLKQSQVLVVGAGGLGCPVLQYLAAAGVGTIGIVDYDIIDESNLQRQVLYSTEDVGKSKAETATQKISKLNPFIQLITHNTKLETTNAIEIISNYDIVVDCSDNLQTRYLINDACILLNKPFVFGAIFKFEGQLSVFNLQSINGDFGPTYRCVFPETQLAKEIGNCSGTGVIGTLPGIIGTMQANEIIKIITGVGEVCSGKLLLFNALTNSMTEIKIKRNETLWEGIPKTISELKNKNYFSFRKEAAIQMVK